MISTRTNAQSRERFGGISEATRLTQETERIYNDDAAQTGEQSGSMLKPGTPHRSRGIGCRSVFSSAQGAKRFFVVIGEWKLDELISRFATRRRPPGERGKAEPLRRCEAGSSDPAQGLEG
jgi:hypothetical protein